MDKSSEPLLEISLPADADESDDIHLSFYSFHEISDWAEKELEFWKDCLGIAGDPGSQPGRDIWNTFIAVLQNISAHANGGQSEFEGNEDIKEVDDPRLAGHVANIETVLPHFLGGNALLSTSAKAKYISALKDQNIRVHTYAAFTGLPCGNAALQLQGMLEAYRFRHGPEDSFSPTREALDGLENQFIKTLASLNEELRGRIGNLEKTIEGFEERHETTLQATEETLAKLDATYRDQIATREAVTYWDTKGDKHKHISWGFSVAVAGWFTTGVFAIYSIFAGLSSTKPPGVAAGFVALLGKESEAGPILFALGGLAIIIYLWIARLLVRFLLSNSHLATDAAERKVATQVFLALMDDESSGVSPEDRKYILDTIFRPTQLGMIKEESAPPSLIGSMANYLDRR